MSKAEPLNKLTVRSLLDTGTVEIRDVRCSGNCRHRSPMECAGKTHFVFPYEGVFMRHVQQTETVAQANQLIFFNDDEEYAISHPVAGGDACLSIAIDEELLSELAPTEQLDARKGIVFKNPARGIDPHAQRLVSLIRHRLSRGSLGMLEAETLALSLIRRSIGERTSKATATTFGRRKLADRTKLLLAGDLGRRWTLSAIGKEIGVSPIYLTQVFADAEGVSLYRYQLRLRLARALELLGSYDDLTMLALDLGFSGHSHFSTAFKQHYGQSPRQFRRAANIADWPKR